LKFEFESFELKFEPFELEFEFKSFELKFEPFELELESFKLKSEFYIIRTEIRLQYRSAFQSFNLIGWVRVY